MDLMHVIKSNEKIAGDVSLMRKSKKKGKKAAKKKKLYGIQGSSVDEEGSARCYFVSRPECRILYKQISESFTEWLSWQRKILICGLTEKCSKSLVRTMATVVEPLLHNGSGLLSPNARKRTDVRMRESIPKVNELIKDGYDLDMNLSSSGLSFFSTVNNDSEPRSIWISPSISRETKMHHSSFLPNIIKETNVSSSERKSFQTGHYHHDKDLIQSAKSKSFFPEITLSKTIELGNLCATNSAFRTSKHLEEQTARKFKNRKWWPLSATSSTFLLPSGKKLLQNFKTRLSVIYEWFNSWNDAEQGACFLQLLPLCTSEELEYFSQCILQRLKERGDINRLPDNLLLKIFNYLSAEEVLNAGSVCKRWNSLATDQRLWRNKCSILGLENGLPRIAENVERAANGSLIDWKITYKDLIFRLKEREAEIISDIEGGEEDETIPEEEGDNVSCITSGTWDETESVTGADEFEELVDEAEKEAPSSASGMSDYLNGNLAMIEDTMHQLSSQSKRKANDDVEEDTALDIRPEMSVQASNKLLQDFPLEDENRFKFIDVDSIRSLKRVRKLQGHLDGVLALKFDKKRVISGSADRTVRIWDVRSGRSVRKLKGHKGGVRALCIDKEHIITGSWDTAIFVWHAIKFKRVATLIGHKDCVSCLDVNDDILLSGSHDKTIKVWDKMTWSCIRTMKGHEGCVTSVCLLENDQALTGSMDRTVKHWDIMNGVCLKTFHGSKEVILTVKSCGDLVAAGAQDGNLLFWDMTTGTCEAIIMAHTGPLHSLSFAGARFVTAGGDQLVKEWDLSTCCCLRSLTGHKDVVFCVQASPKRIVSGSADGTVRIWDFGNHVQQVGAGYDEDNKNLVIARVVEK